MRTLSPERLKEFKDIFEKEHNHKFKNDEEALDAANNLLGFFEILYDVAKQDYFRKEKLKDHPKGFPIDDDGTYTCFICCTSITTANGWYDKYGLKCLDCQRATDEGVLPPIVFDDRNSWFSMWKLESEFKLHSATIRKMVRKGELKARIVLSDGGKPHYYVFLINENIEFLKKLNTNIKK